MININLVNKHLQFPQVSLKEPLESGFMLIAAEVDSKTSFWGESSTKKNLLKELKLLQTQLINHENVIEIALFKASLFPPIHRQDNDYLIKAKRNQIIHDHYDIVILIEMSSVKAIQDLKSNEDYLKITHAIIESSSYHFIYQAKNLKRIDSVNHQKGGVFLFNFFVAENAEQNLGIWEYTAGWFEDQTNLDNSTLFGSIDSESSAYSVINHCRWNGFINVLPSLILKKTFKTYVLENFAANNVSAIPILYRLA